MKKRFKHLLIGALAVTLLMALPVPGRAYDVWIGTLQSTQPMVDDPSTWALSSKAVGGLAINWAPSPTFPPRLQPASRADFVALLGHAKNHTYQVMRHPDAGFGTNDSINGFEGGGADPLGYLKEYIYIYDDGGADSYSIDEVNNMRTWLDNNGAADVKLAYSARAGDKTRVRDLISIPAMEGCGSESNIGRWLDPTEKRHDFLRWVTDPTNAATLGERFFFHTHFQNEKEGPPSTEFVWQNARKMVRTVVRDDLSDRLDWLRSSNCVFVFFGGLEYPVLPNSCDKTPELNPGGATYGQSFFGLILSLIEQRPKFEWRQGALPTDAECESFARGYSYTAVADGSLTNSNTWAVPLPVAGDINTWLTGTHTVGAHGSADNVTNTFNGGTLMVGPNGTLDAHANGTTLKLRNVQLSGGTIAQASGSGTFKLDLTNQSLTLNSGTLKAGGTAGQNLQFSRAALVGNGTIAVTAAGAAGCQVIFDDTVNANAFKGTFDVKSNGVLRLPAVAGGLCSLALSGTGKFVNDTNVVFKSLTIAGTNLPGGIYYYTNFTVAQRAFLVNTHGKISVLGDCTAIADGNVDDPATWLVGPPPAGDENAWKTGVHSLSASDAGSNPLSFYGDTLVVQPGGQLIPAGGGATIKLNNLTLDGGLIATFKLLAIDFDLTGHTFTLNSGTIQAGKSANSRNLKFHNANLAGSGIINITALDGAGFYIEFTDNIDFSGFAGVFDVITNGTLQLSSDSIDTPSFGLRLSSNGKLNDTGTNNLLLASLVMDGVAIPEGTYHYTNFTLAQQVHFANTNQLVTVVDTAYQQWADDNGVGGKNEDDDADGESNYYEFATGGNPTEPADRGQTPTAALRQISNTNWLEYVHIERKPTPTSRIQYFVEASDSLIVPTWTTNGVLSVGRGPLDSEFDRVTNRVSTAVKNQQFVRLRIQ